MPPNPAWLLSHSRPHVRGTRAQEIAARSHASGATPAEKKRHVADAAAFDARELGGRYHALHKFVPCRSRYLPNK